eukprot:SAG31_NODE_985_length_10549_cov_2.605339_13_plen_159_part_00
MARTNVEFIFTQDRAGRRDLTRAVRFFYCVGINRCLVCLQWPCALSKSHVSFPIPLGLSCDAHRETQKLLPVHDGRCLKMVLYLVCPKRQHFKTWPTHTSSMVCILFSKNYVLWIIGSGAVPETYKLSHPLRTYIWQLVVHPCLFYHPHRAPDTCGIV